MYSFDAWDDLLAAVDGLLSYPTKGIRMRVVVVRLDPKQINSCRDAHVGDFVRLADNFKWFMYVPVYMFVGLRGMATMECRTSTNASRHTAPHRRCHCTAPHSPNRHCTTLEHPNVKH